jgi:hypothetical protein
MMRGMRRRLVHLGVLGASLVLVAGLAGCGASSHDPLPALENIGAVAAKSKSAESFAFDLLISQEVLGQELSITADGAFDNRSNRGRMSFDLSSFARLLTGFGEAFGAKQGDLPPEFKDPEKWKLEVLLDGTRAYLRFPVLASKLGGKEWISGDVAELAAAKGVDLGQIGSVASTDPRSALDALKAVSGTIDGVGREEVDGVETTHYRATLDPAKIAAQAGAAGASSDILSSLRNALAQANLSSIPIDLWVDDDGLLRKYVIDVALEEGGQKATTSVILRLHDYGAPVELDLPDAGDVVDASTLEP